MKILPRAILLAVLLVPAARAAPASVDAVLKRFVDSREIAGAVALVGDDEKSLGISVAGMADIATEKPMKEDTVFRIASMTKPITATAAMMLAEAGKISMDDPVSKYLPGFGGDKAAITIAQCLSHTSGLSDVPRDETKTVATLEQLMPLIAAKPLRFPPGSKWEYNQSGLNVVGRIVEIASGKSFPDFLQERLFGPLGMKDTGFYPSPETAARLTTTYRKSADGTLAAVDQPQLSGGPPGDKSRYPSASGGLFSTAPDYARFARMILRGGELDGKRYLSADSVKRMTTARTGDLATGFTPGNAWAIGWCVVRQPQGVSAALKSGSFGHGGAFGTQIWIDPANNRFYLLMVQRADFPNSDASDLRRDFQNAAAESF